MSITCAQAKDARKLLGWSQMRLAVRAGVAYATISRYETGHKRLGGETIAAIQSTLESAGVDFTDEPPGLKKRAAAPTTSDEAALPEIPDDDPYDGAPV